MENVDEASMMMTTTRRRRETIAEGSHDDCYVDGAFDNNRGEDISNDNNALVMLLLLGLGF